MKFFRVDYLHMLMFVNRKYREKFNKLLRSMYNEEIVTQIKYIKQHPYSLQWYNFYGLENYDEDYGTIIFPYFSQFDSKYALGYFRAYYRFGKIKILVFWIQNYNKYFKHLQINDISDLSVENTLVYWFQAKSIPLTIQSFNFYMRWKISFSYHRCIRIAIQKNNHEYVGILLSKYRFSTKKYYSMLITAMREEKYEIVRHIIEYVKLGTNGRDKNLMNCALKRKNFEMIEFLYDNGCMVLKKMKRALSMIEDEKLAQKINDLIK